MSDDSPLPPAQHLGFCRYCGRAVHDRSFSQPSAEAEYDRWVACAPCHDTLGLAPEVREGVSDRTVVLHGLVFAAALEGSQVLEVVLLPFQYAPWHGRFEFEPADIVRAGASLAPLDPLVELAAVRTAWDRLAASGCSSWTRWMIRCSGSARSTITWSWRSTARRPRRRSS